MQFLVLSRREIENYKCDKAHIVISIKDPETEIVGLPYNDTRLSTLYLAFHDFDDLSKDYPGKIRLFNKEDAKKIVEFVNHYKNKIEIIVCNCEAGISRSAGVAGALSKIFNKDDTEIFKNYLPNMLVYRTIYETYRKIK